MNAFVRRRFGGVGIGAVVAAILALLCLGSSAWAAPITFAQLLQHTPSQQPFVYTNNSSSATFNSATFNIDLVIGSALLAILPPGTNSMQAATFTMTSSTSSPATQSGSNLAESFPTASTNTMQITLNNAINGSTNFLTVTYSGHLGGNVGASAFGLTSSQSSGDTINYSSGVAPSLNNSTTRGLSLSFSSATPTLGLGAGNFYNSFIASGAGGDFSATLPSVPEPTGLILAGTMFSAVAAFRRRKSRNVIA
jgi:hypothetical protein